MSQVEAPKPQIARFVAGVFIMPLVAMLIWMWTYAPSHPDIDGPFMDGAYVTLLSAMILGVLVVLLWVGLSSEPKPKE